MKIGIIIHSNTGNTLSVANTLASSLQKSGHSVKVERVSASVDSETNPASIKLLSIPDIAGYDMLIFGAPVRGYRLSPVMEAYLLKQSSFKGKIISGFVTQFFPFPSMGGNQSIARLNEICRNKGVELSKTAIINWINPIKRKKLIETAIKNLTAPV